MLKKRLKHPLVIGVSAGILLLSSSASAMGLRAFVALPVEKGGNVVRFQLLHNTDKDVTHLITSGAYGFNAKQTLLLGLPYRLSPSGKNRLGDASVLFRQIIAQNDSKSGTNRFALLGGAVIPSDGDQDPAVQGGFVDTHFNNRNEIDVDAIYQKGIDNRPDSGRYDLSWQYRLTPAERPDWGIATELNSVVELGGRWQQGKNTTHQLTLGLQLVHQKWVIEGGVTQDLNNEKDLALLVSTRFHF